jgi:hypothetical protein
MLRNIRDGGRGQEPTVTKAYMGVEFQQTLILMLHNIWMTPNSVY